MPIDPEKAIGHTAPIGEYGWTSDDVILYHLGIGAGMQDPTDPAELRYLYERDLAVLPTIATTVFPLSYEPLLAVPGLDFDPTKVLHAGQEIVIHRPFQPEEMLTGTFGVPAVWDKGKAAIVEMETTATDRTGEKVFTATGSAFLRGEGGFGGDPGPSSEDPTPSRPADLVIERPTLVQQAALYRLNGDHNALHIDPTFAKHGGFDKPILHGLCSYGIALKAAVDQLLDGDPSRVTRYAVRMAGVVFPGETLVVSLWHEAGRSHLTADVKERSAPALTRGVVEHQ